MAGWNDLNESSILQQLKDGTAKFELVNSPVSPISTQIFSSPFRREKCSTLFFAKIGSFFGGGGGGAAGGDTGGGGTSPAMKKVERFSVRKVTGDGRCLFRALVKGMAINKGIGLSQWQERNDADELRMAVKEVICGSGKERRQYEEALIAITVEESLPRYCQRIEGSDFWGGESELLVLSKLCRQPIVVYIPEHEHNLGGWGGGFIPIAEYGDEFRKSSKNGEPRKAVKLLYSGKNHYDLLV
ncbi:OTU domain-containing protein At3g57810-like [Papaver somniferum]|uniref:OTU domain-containing protein At3g57810-like n=1 Tax=Papaver somniferum TaxID=3469 RepID=UPI000E6FF72B|nr:OTU domain-containing protein At3g57810-like [Papaver somniferum]